MATVEHQYPPNTSDADAKRNSLSWAHQTGWAEAEVVNVHREREEDGPRVVIELNDASLTPDPARTSGDTPPNNPAEQVGETAEDLEAAADTLIEAAEEAGRPDLAREVAEATIATLADWAEQEEQAAEVLEEVAEEIALEAEATNQPEVAAVAEEAIEEAQEVQEEAQETQRTAAHDLSPQSTHPWFRPIGRKAKA